MHLSNQMLPLLSPTGKIITLTGKDNLDAGK
jgi:hypothetical protein